MNTRKIARVCYEANRADAGGWTLPVWDEAGSAVQEREDLKVCELIDKIKAGASPLASGMPDLSAAIVAVFVRREAPAKPVKPEPKAAVKTPKSKPQKLIERLRKK